MQVDRRTVTLVVSLALWAIGSSAFAADPNDPCSFYWESGCTGGLDCGVTKCCEAEWDDCDRWDDQCSTVCCAYCYPLSAAHAATIERDNATTGEGYLQVGLSTETVKSLTIRTSSATNASLDLRLVNQDTAGNTLTVDQDLSISGSNGIVTVAIKEKATVDVKETLVISGSSNEVTVILSGTGVLKTS